MKPKNKKTNFEKFYNECYSKNKEYKGGFIDDKIGKYRFEKLKRLIDSKIPKLDWNNSKLLDIGCSTGEFLNFLPGKNKNKYGIDISKIAVEKTIKKGFNAKVSNAECGTLPFKNNSFDVIFIMEILEHIFNAEHIMREIYRILKPKGYLIITVPNDLMNWRSVFLVGIKRQHPLVHPTYSSPYECQHIRFFNKHYLAKFTKDNGLKNIYIGGLPPSYKGIKIPFGTFMADTFTDMTTRDYVAICQKK